MAASPAVDNLVMHVLTPKQMVVAIRGALLSGEVPFIWGPPGIAKSQIAQQIATAAGIAFIDIRLSQMDPTDLRGMPYPTYQGGREGVRWSTPYQLPQDLDLDFIETIPEACDHRIAIANPIGSNGIHYCTSPKVLVTSLTPGAVAKIIPQYVVNDDEETLYFNEDGESSTDVAFGEPKMLPILDRVFVMLVDGDGNMVPGRVRVKVKGKVKGIIALEEFNSADQTVMAASYQFLLDRRLGEYVIPDGFAVMAMGNRETDKGLTFKLPSPASNRFVHYEMKSSTKDWLDWAYTANIHPQVVGFITAFEDQLFDFDPAAAAKAFATPRTWEKVSNILWANPDLSSLIFQAHVCGAVGMGAGSNFVEHCEHAKDLPRAGDILSGKITDLNSEKISVQYALTVSMVYELQQELDTFKHKRDYKKSDAYLLEWMPKADRFMSFVMKNFKPDVTVMAVRLAVNNRKLPFHTSKMEGFIAFARRHRNVVLVS